MKQHGGAKEPRVNGVDRGEYCTSILGLEAVPLNMSDAVYLVRYWISQLLQAHKAE